MGREILDRIPIREIERQINECCLENEDGSCQGKENYVCGKCPVRKYIEKYVHQPKIDRVLNGNKK